MDLSTYISLFSGSAGLDLAIGLAISSARCVCFCEREIGAVRILAARMEDGSIEPAPIWLDVRSFPGQLYRGRVGGIVGGFPCTDLSVAGKRAGITGEHSGLWFEYLRLIREIQPGWVFIENVPAVLGPAAGPAVLGGLAGLGFDARWRTLRASDCGLPHQRKRAFIFAFRPELASAAVGGRRELRQSSGRDGLTGGGAAQGWKTPHGLSSADGGAGSLRSSQLDGRAPMPAIRTSGTTEMGGHQQNLSGMAHNWPSPDANAINDGESPESWKARRDLLKAKGYNGNGAGMPLAIAGPDWTTPQAHDSGGGDPRRVRRYGTKHGCANLADDVTAWRPE